MTHPDLFGLILGDHIQTKDKIIYYSERDDNLIEQRSSEIYFLSSDNWREAEVNILENVGNKILDVGCGAGRHSFHLQETGHIVTALDNSEGALGVCRQRGVKNTILGSIFQLGNLGNKFDSILFFGSNLSLCGSPDNLLDILQTLHEITSNEGNVIFDFRSPVPTDNPIHLRYHQKNTALGIPVGQLKFRLRYLDQKSDWINFYLPTRDELDELLIIAGWEITRELIEGRTHYMVINKSI